MRGLQAIVETGNMVRARITKCLKDKEEMSEAGLWLQNPNSLYK